VTERWTFGVEPLPQTLELAPLLRRVTGLALALEQDDPAVAKLVDDLRAAERALADVAPADAAPRIGDADAPERRVYVDHSRDIGAYNPCFPEYDITVVAERAHGTVTFPLAFEGPPGVVFGGVIATFFDAAIQHHNCDVGVAGKTTSLLVEYRRPTPIGTTLDFDIERVVDDRRITSHARLLRDSDVCCTARMEAVAGDLSKLPAVSPRRRSP
jgi:hypothetical protein